MLDNREAILARLAVLLAAIAGIESFARNRGLVANDSRPGIVLLDGDESERPPRVGRNLTGRQSMLPVFMAMKPQIFVLMDARQPQNVDVGTDINAFRTAIIRAIAADTTLRSLVGTNGDIVYNGSETDLKSGSPLDGEMRLDFTFSYFVDPY